MIEKIITTIFGVWLAITGSGGEPQQEPQLGAFGDPFISIQLATDPDNGECLTTDGTDNVWASCSSGSGDITGGASLGTGLNIFDSKSGSTLRFNSISAGSNITLSTTSNNNTIVISSTASGGGSGNVSTSSVPTIGNLSYWTTDTATPALLGKVATSSVTINAPLTSAGTAGFVVGGSGWTLDIDDIKAADLDLSDITLNDFTNDANFIDLTDLSATYPISYNNGTGAFTFGWTYPFPSGATTTPISFTYASSTYHSFTTASTTFLNIGGDSLNNLEGTGLIVSGNALGFDCSDVEGTGINCSGENITLDATGDWTGTLDGFNGFGYPFPSAATTTRVTFSGGLDFTYSSSTIYSSFETASTSALVASNSVNLFGGGAKTSANALCIQLTGSADLCDGSDSEGAGGSVDGTGVANTIATWTDGNTIQATSSHPLYVGSIFATSSSLISTLPRLTSSYSSSTAFSSFAIASTTFLNIGGDSLNDLEGDGLVVTGNALLFDCSDVASTGLQCSGEDLQLNATGDWTGTLDSLEAASFLRSDASDSYTSGTLTFNAGTSVDLDNLAVNSILTTGSAGVLTATSSHPLYVGAIVATSTTNQSTFAATTTHAALQVGPTAIANNALKVSIPTGLDISGSESVGGLINCNTSTSDEICLVLYGNSTGSSRTISIVQDSTSYSGIPLHIRNDGTGTSLNIACNPQGLGCLKIGAQGAGDADAALTSFDASTSGFLGQAMFMKCGTNSTCWNLRDSANTQVLTVSKDGYYGWGTTTPQWQVQIATSSKPQLTLSDVTGNHWSFRADGATLTIGTTSPTTFATSTPSHISIARDGFGTTTLRGLNISGLATSTSNVGFNITNGCYAINGTCVGGGGAGHDEVTLAGEDFLSLSGQQITANPIDPDNLASADFGDFTCNGTTCSFDADTVGDSEIDTSASLTWSTLQNFNYSSSTIYSSFQTSSSTLGIFGTLRVPVLTSALTLTDGSGNFAEYAGTSCTNQFVRSLSALGAATCEGVGTNDVSGLDISADTNLAATWPIILTNDTLSFGWTYPFPSSATSTLITFSGGLNASGGTATFGTIAGAIDAGGATSFEIPNGTGPTVDATGEMAIDTTSDQFVYFGNSLKRVLTPIQRLGFSYATTTWSGTTTIYLGPAYQAISVNYAMCETDTGTVNVSLYDGTNRANLLNASTTIGEYTYSTNNTFTRKESMRVDIGTPASSPTRIACSFGSTITAD